MTGEEFLTPESVEPLRRALSASAGRFVVPDPAASPGEVLTVPLPSRLRLAAMLEEVVPTDATEASLALRKVRVVDRGRETVRWRFDAPAQVLRSGGRTGMVSRATPEMEALFRSAGIPTGRGRAQAPSDAAVVECIRAALPFEVSITMTREPFDDVRRVTLERADGRGIPWQSLADVRRTLRELVPEEFAFVVRDRFSLRGPRDRATALLPEGAIEPVTAETIRARLGRSFKLSYPTLP